MLAGADDGSEGVDGTTDTAQWVRTFTVSTSLDDVVWVPYQEDGAEKTFVTQEGRNTLTVHTLRTSAAARYVRVHPTSNFSWVAMRGGVYIADPPLKISTKRMLTVDFDVEDCTENNFTMVLRPGRNWGDHVMCYTHIWSYDDVLYP